MITREEVRKDILQLKASNILCELPTSFGKTKIALDILKEKVFKTNPTAKVLIVVPRLVLISNWKDEFKKWDMQEYLDNVEFVTYVSFAKKAGNWDACIFDEAHHLSLRCRDNLKHFNIKKSVLLSATMKRELKDDLRVKFKSLYTYKITMKQAINDEVLPDPKVYLIPLYLDNKNVNCKIIKNPKAKHTIAIDFRDRFKYNKVKNTRIVITCTQKEYYDDTSNLISWYKNRIFLPQYENLFLRKSGERLKWLSEQKTPFVKLLLNKLSNKRTLTFCSSIKQTEDLGKYCINSKDNKRTKEYLESFNNKEINHITACNMLDEGCNLSECQIGVYASLNSSTRMIIQKQGRILRHKEPILIIPYYKNTRDEDIVNKMLENYNKDLIEVINNLNDLKL